MIGAADLPVWAAIVISFFLVSGAFLTLVGCIGLVRFKSFYERIHAPTIGSSFGAGGILIASIMFFSILQSKPILHEVLITVFVVITTPVTLMLLSRAVIKRRTAKSFLHLPTRNDGWKHRLEAFGGVLKAAANCPYAPCIQTCGLKVQAI